MSGRKDDWLDVESDGLSAAEGDAVCVCVCVCRG